MAKEVAIEKRAKISEAQKMMLLAVLGAAIFLGSALALSNQIIKRISFNADVIAEEERSIAAYSNAIRQTGICKKPSGEVYSEDEIKKCNPDAISIDEIPGTLRANILKDVASNKALMSVPTTSDRSCLKDEKTKEYYTYEDFEKMYEQNRNNSEGMARTNALVKSCSALRVIPDALPAVKNEVALLASLNKIFQLSGWVPDGLGQANSDQANLSSANLHALSVRLAVEDAGSEITLRILDNIEHSIREFSIDQATIEWSNHGLNLNATATAYYMDQTTLKETSKVISADNGSK